MHPPAATLDNALLDSVGDLGVGEVNCPGFARISASACSEIETFVDLQSVLAAVALVVIDDRTARWRGTQRRAGRKDASHFTRAFKERHGFSPREYRRRLAG